MNQKETVINVKNLGIGVYTEQGNIQLTENINFSLKKGEVYALVGESGCGKSITAFSLMGLLPDNGYYHSGSIQFQSHEIINNHEQALMKLRGKEIAMIFQEPAAAMNPLMTIRDHMLEVFVNHGLKKDEQACSEMLTLTGINDVPRVMKSYPHELSGGMLQRVMISMALLLKPKVIIADEPTTALDVTIQAQIMELLCKLQRDINCTVLLITHNINLVAQYAQRVAVMYAGRIVEEGRVQDVLDSTRHPYTKALLEALPQLTEESSLPKPIKGSVPSPHNYVAGCRFADRCSEKSHECSYAQRTIQLTESHSVQCSEVRL